MDVISINSEPEQEQENTLIDLSQYKDAAIIPETPKENVSPVVEMGIPPENEPEEQSKNEPDWRGNPDYYQTGKKAGQRRQQKPRTKVEYTGTYTESEIGADIITGAMFISLIDLLMPMAFATLNNYLTGEKIKPSDLSLSADQCRKLEPIADKAMSYVKLRGNPLIILGLTLLGLYSMQLVKAKMEYKVKKMNEPETPKGKETTSGQYQPEKK